MVGVAVVVDSEIELNGFIGSKFGVSMSLLEIDRERVRVMIIINF